MFNSYISKEKRKEKVFPRLSLELRGSLFQCEDWRLILRFRCISTVYILGRCFFYPCTALLIKNRKNALTSATAKPAFTLEQDKELSEGGFLVNHARVLVGSGLETFEKGKRALQSWRHFSLNWAFVDPKTPIQSGAKFCVCTKTIFPWLMMPLKVVYVDDSRNQKTALASYSYGSGTLQGHLLAGEECFSITMDEQNDVWYEILSFSKPANLLSFIGYPYVLLKQKHFAHESTLAMKKHLSAKLDNVAP